MSLTYSPSLAIAPHCCVSFPLFPLFPFLSHRPFTFPSLALSFPCPLSFVLHSLYTFVPLGIYKSGARIWESLILGGTAKLRDHGTSGVAGEGTAEGACGIRSGFLFCLIFLCVFFGLGVSGFVLFCFVFGLFLVFGFWFFPWVCFYTIGAVLVIALLNSPRCCHSKTASTVMSYFGLVAFSF